MVEYWKNGGEMVVVVMAYSSRINGRRILTQNCLYYVLING